MTSDENMVALSVKQQIEDTGCSEQAALERVAAEFGVQAESFDGAVSAVRRVVKKHRTAPNALHEY